MISAAEIVYDSAMAVITYAKSAAAVLKGTEHLVVFAPAAVTRAKVWPKLLGAKLDRMLLKLAEDLKPGDLGRIQGTHTAAKPERLSLAVLPDAPSRYCGPARGESIRNCMGQVGGSDKLGVVLVLDGEEHVIAALNAVARALPLFSMKSGNTGEKLKKRRVQIVCVDRSGKPLEVDAWARAVVDATREAAAQVDAPPTDFDPAGFSRRARELLAQIRGVEVQEFVGDALVKHGMRGVHAVGRAAVGAPRVLVATWNGKKRGGRHLALVGKGVTFDTGGLHIKARGSMETMKSDMGGAAAVLGAFHVLATCGYPERLSLVLCMAENAVGPTSFKPDDILTMHSGKTVEINNTDAEGRLLLSDGVSYAARVLGADTIFDAATLTGAQMVATGRNHAAIVSNDEGLEDTVIAAAYASGDLVHPLPFAPELYQSEFASKVADMKNSVRDRNNAQSSCAAQFIWSHIADQKRRWCHVDLAGPSFQAGRGTGFGVALLVASVLMDSVVE